MTQSSPLPVEIQQPIYTPGRTLGNAAITVGGLFLAAFLVMLLLPTFTPWLLGYWQAVAALVTIRLVAPPRNHHHLARLVGTKPPKRAGDAGEPWGGR